MRLLPTRHINTWLIGGLLTVLCVIAIIDYQPAPTLTFTNSPLPAHVLQDRRLSLQIMTTSPVPTADLLPPLTATNCRLQGLCQAHFSIASLPTHDKDHSYLLQFSGDPIEITNLARSIRTNIIADEQSNPRLYRHVGVLLAP